MQMHRNEINKKTECRFYGMILLSRDMPDRKLRVKIDLGIFILDLTVSKEKYIKNFKLIYQLFVNRISIRPYRIPPGIITTMTSNKDEIYKKLRYRIITHELKPMEPLNEKVLMDHYGIGRTPMREVLLQLQRDGLIQRFSRSGTIVSPVDIHIYKHNIEIRTVLEKLAGELAAQRITPDELKALEEILTLVKKLEEQDHENIKELMQCEFDFHNLIYQSTHNPKLIDMLNELQGISARFWHYQMFSKQELLDQFIDHRKVLAALNKKDGRRAGEILQNHIQKVLKKIGDKVLK